MMVRGSVALVLVLALPVISGGPLAAQTQASRSVYTSTAAKACGGARPASKKDDSDDGGTRVCKGPPGLVVAISEDDLRETVSIGRNAAAAAREPAAQSWFGPFNSTTDTIEWRLGADGKPFAAIQRWHLADNDDTGKDHRPINKQMLVVTRLPPGAVCHVAYIDVKSNPDANTIARSAADELARDFDCGKATIKVIGQPGRATELATRK